MFLVIIYRPWGVLHRTSSDVEQLKEQWEELPPYFITSSENRMGRKELLDYIESINKSLNSKQ